MSKQIYVFRCPGSISEAAAKKLKDAAKADLGPDAVVFVLGDGMELNVIQDGQKD